MKASSGGAREAQRSRATIDVPTASELYRWGLIDERRRRRNRGVTRVFSPLAISALAGLAVGGLIAATVRGDGAGAVRLALAAIATANIVVVFATPYRMYWRSDSALLGRLPVAGGVLFRLAMLRSLRATGFALLPSLAGAVAIGVAGEAFDVGIRVALVAVASAMMAGLLAPAACLAAGNIVASDKAQAVLDSFGGELRAPKISWLGTLPGLVATAVALLGIICAPWVRLESTLASAPAVFCAIGAAASLIAFAWAYAAADRVLLLAQREIAALDQERLAHIDRSQASWLERLWATAAVSAGARVIYDKDAALMRRRFPAPYFVAIVGIALTWIFAATGEQGTAVATLFTLAAYALVMARRLATGPVEHPRLLRALPLAPGAARRAKRAAALLRALFWCGGAGAALPVFASNIAVAGGLAGAALAIAAIGGIALAEP